MKRRIALVDGTKRFVQSCATSASAVAQLPTAATAVAHGIRRARRTITLLAFGAAEILPPSLLPRFLQYLLPPGAELAHEAVAIRHGRRFALGLLRGPLVALGGHGARP